MEMPSPFRRTLVAVSYAIGGYGQMLITLANREEFLR